MKTLKTKSKRKMQGFTLLEVVVSMVILSIVIPGTFSLFVYANKSLEEARQRLQAVNQAQSVLENLRYYVSADLTAGSALNNTAHSPNEISLPNNPDISNVDSPSWTYGVTSVDGSNNKMVEVVVNWGHRNI